MTACKPMKISGKTIFHRSPEELWELLMNPTVLRRCIPGCERVEADGEHVFRLKLRLGLGLFKGRFKGIIRMLDVQRPESYRMLVEARGRTGVILGENLVRLSVLGGGRTELEFSGSGKVDGRVGFFCGKMLDGVAREFSEEFFAALSRL